MHLESLLTFELISALTYRSIWLQTYELPPQPEPPLQLLTEIPAVKITENLYFNDMSCGFC